MLDYIGTALASWFDFSTLQWGDTRIPFILFAVEILFALLYFKSWCSMNEDRERTRAYLLFTWFLVELYCTGLCMTVGWMSTANIISCCIMLIIASVITMLVACYGMEMYEEGAVTCLGMVIFISVLWGLVILYVLLSFF